jgi:hypothetical protein
MRTFYPGFLFWLLGQRSNHTWNPSLCTHGPFTQPFPFRREENQMSFRQPPVHLLSMLFGDRNSDVGTIAHIPTASSIVIFVFLQNESRLEEW